MKNSFLTFALLMFSFDAYSAIQVEKTVFSKENYNQLKHPKSLAKFNRTEPQTLPNLDLTNAEPTQKNEWVPATKVIEPVIEPVAEPIEPDPVFQQEVRRRINPPAQPPQIQIPQPVPAQPLTLQPPPPLQPLQLQQPYQPQQQVMPIIPAVPSPQYKGEEYLVDKGNFFAITPKLGTQGVGADIAIKINDYLRIRGGGNYMSFSGSHQVNNIDYDYEASIANGNSFVDIHPFRSGFRITGGAFYQPDELELKATPSTSQNIGGTSYTPTEIGTITSKIETGDISPYAGIGYSDVFTTNGRNRNWFLETDLGVKFNDVTSTITSTGSLANDSTFRANLERENTTIQDEFDILEFYPILNIGITYKF